MSRFSNIPEAAPAIGVAFVVVGLALYLVAGILAVFWQWEPVYEIFIGNPAANVGIPCSAFSAFVIVATLLKAYPPKTDDGQVELKFFGLEFTGPAGPISLWIACFLSLIVAVNMLKLDRPAVAAQSSGMEITG